MFYIMDIKQLIADAVLFPIFLVCLCSIASFFYKISSFFLRDKSCYFPLFSYPVVGLFCLGFLSLLLNFIVGVNNTVTYIFIVSIIVLGAKLNSSILFDKKILLLVLFGILVSPIAGNMEPGPDGALYHLPHQRWIRDSPIVFGLANLHGRFGFSSFQEYIGSVLWLGKNFKFLSYAVSSFFVSFLIFIKYSYNSENPHIRTMAVFTSVAIIIINPFELWWYTYTDITTGLLFAMSFILGLDLVSQDSIPTALLEKKLYLFLLLSSLDFALKLSSATIMLWAAFIVIILLIQRAISLRHLFSLVTIPFIFLVTWITRGIITTGCVFYPAAWSCLNVSWNARLNALYDAKIVTAIARNPNDASLSSLGNFSWIADYWIHAYKILIVNYFILSSILIIACIALKLFTKMKNINFYIRIIGFFVIFISFLIWFFQAPVIRFGIGVLITLAPTVCVIFFGSPISNNIRIYKIICTLLIFSLIIKEDVYFFQSRPSIYFTEVRFGPISIKVLRPAEIDVVSDKNFGVRPKIANDCWLEPYCSPYDRPKPKVYNGYFFFEQHN